MRQLPKTWEMKKLEELCDLVRGTEPGSNAYFNEQKEDHVQFIRVGDLTGKIDNPKFVDKKLSNLTIVDPDEILISFDGTPGVVVKGWNGAISSGIRVVQNIKPGIIKDYLFYYLQTPAVQLVIKFHTTGVTILHGSRAIPHIKILVPHLSIQQKIVEQLDAIRKAQDLNDKQIALADEFFQTLLHKELYSKARNWKSERIKDIALFKRGPFGGSLKKEIFVSIGYKVYEQRNAIYGDFTLGNYFINKAKYNEMIDFAIKPNDLIISCSGTIGKVAIVPDNAPPGIINQALLKITPKTDFILGSYLKLVIESKPVQAKLVEKTRGSAIRNVASVKEIKRIKIPLPPISDQYRIVVKLRAVQDYTKKLFEQQEKLCELFASCLAKTMRGKLVD